MITGSIVQRGGNRETGWRFAIILEMGRFTDPATGRSKRKQKWVKYRSPANVTKVQAKKRANAELAKRIGEVNRQEFVEPSKLLLVDFLRAWFKERVEPVNRPATCVTYKTVIETHIADARIGQLPIQQITAADIEGYYLALNRSAATVGVHNSVLSRAFNHAVKKKVVTNNPMRLHKIDRPAARQETDDDTSRDDVRDNSWSRDDARRFLAAAKADTPQNAAFFALALDSGGRKSELYGLTWDRIDLDRHTVRIDRQLSWLHGPVQHAPLKTDHGRKGKKNGRRVVVVAPETAALLRAHRASQNALRLRNGPNYVNGGFCFAVEPEHQRTIQKKLGAPLTRFDSIFTRLIKASGVKPITFHGLRHTTASLLVANGEPITNVADRLGHEDCSITLRTYSHVEPGSGAATATAIGGMLFGS